MTTNRKDDDGWCGHRAVAEALEAALTALDINIEAANDTSESYCKKRNYKATKEMFEFAAYLTAFRDQVAALHAEWMETEPDASVPALEAIQRKDEALQ